MNEGEIAFITVVGLGSIVVFFIAALVGRCVEDSIVNKFKEKTKGKVWRKNKKIADAWRASSSKANNLEIVRRLSPPEAPNRPVVFRERFRK